MLSFLQLLDWSPPFLCFLFIWPPPRDHSIAHLLNLNLTFYVNMPPIFNRTVIIVHKLAQFFIEQLDIYYKNTVIKQENDIASPHGFG